MDWTAIAACRKPVYLPPSLSLLADVSGSRAEECYVILPGPLTQFSPDDLQILAAYVQSGCLR